MPSNRRLGIMFNHDPVSTPVRNRATTFGSSHEVNQPSGARSTAAEKGEHHIHTSPDALRTPTVLDLPSLQLAGDSHSTKSSNCPSDCATPTTAAHASAILPQRFPKPNRPVPALIQLESSQLDGRSRAAKCSQPCSRPAALTQSFANSPVESECDNWLGVPKLLQPGVIQPCQSLCRTGLGGCTSCHLEHAVDHLGTFQDAVQLAAVSAAAVPKSQLTDQLSTYTKCSTEGLKDNKSADMSRSSSTSSLPLSTSGCELVEAPTHHCQSNMTLAPTDAPSCSVDCIPPRPDGIIPQSPDLHFMRDIGVCEPSTPPILSRNSSARFDTRADSMSSCSSGSPPSHLDFGRDSSVRSMRSAQKTRQVLQGQLGEMQQQLAAALRQATSNSDHQLFAMGVREVFQLLAIQVPGSVAEEGTVQGIGEIVCTYITRLGFFQAQVQAQVLEVMSNRSVAVENLQSNDNKMRDLETRLQRMTHSFNHVLLGLDQVKLQKADLEQRSRALSRQLAAWQGRCRYLENLVMAFKNAAAAELDKPAAQHADGAKAACPALLRPPSITEQASSASHANVQVLRPAVPTTQPSDSFACSSTEQASPLPAATAAPVHADDQRVQAGSMGNAGAGGTVSSSAAPTIAACDPAHPHTHAVDQRQETDSPAAILVAAVVTPEVNNSKQHFRASSAPETASCTANAAAPSDHQCEGEPAVVLEDRHRDGSSASGSSSTDETELFNNGLGDHAHRQRAQPQLQHAASFVQWLAPALDGRTDDCGMPCHGVLSQST